MNSDNPRDIISARGAKTLLSLHHLSDIATAFHSSVMYVERVMRDQLVAAIGKEVTSKDVDEYTHYITQKMLLPEAAPTPLAYSVRRSSDHSPEGMYTLEHKFPHSSSRTTPLYALTRQVASSSDITTPPHSHMSFPLDASTHIRFSGDQYVHAYLHHSFSDTTTLALDEATVTFSARARQFSSFVLLLGSLTNSDTFDPQYAFVVRSKDELTVALNLAVIPTQKEFKDAIKSLSR